MSDETKVIPGADNAILGVIARCGQPPFVVYDYSKLVDYFMSEGMDHEEACEWIEVNIVGAWVGEGTPGVLISRGTEAYCEMMGHENCEADDSDNFDDDDEHIGDDEDILNGLDESARREIETISSSMADQLLKLFSTFDEPSENGKQEKQEPRNDEDDGA